MKGVGTLTAGEAIVRLRGTSSLTTKYKPSATLTGTSSLTAASTYRRGRIEADLPALLCRMLDSDFSEIRADLPALTLEVAEEYVPLAAQTIYGNLPEIVFSGFMSRSRSGDIDANFPPMLFKAGDFNFGELNASLPALQTLLWEDPTPLKFDFDNLVYTAGSVSAFVDYVFIFDSTANVLEVLTVSRELVASIAEVIQAGLEQSMLSDYSISFYSAAWANLETLAAFSGVPAYAGGADGGPRVWVVNIETKASSQYDNYGFNSFMEIDGQYYGVADDGIYRLDGDDDAGANINALVEVGKSHLGSAQKKKVLNVYAGASSDGKLLLKVNADGQEYTYEARSNTTTLENNRFDVGRGLDGNYFNFTLLNQNGDDFDLETVAFEPIILSRKI